MANTTCPHCGINAHLTLQWLAPLSPGMSETWDFAQTCDGCRRVVSGRVTVGKSVDSSGAKKAIELAASLREIEWLPHRLPSPDFPGVPEGIKEAATEAHRSMGIRNYRAAVLMARSSLEAAAKDHGASGSTLYARIESMSEAGDLTKRITALAHEIRVWGNDMAHGDFSDVVDQDAALDLLSLMDAVLDSLYGHAVRLESLKQRRQ